MLVIDIEGSELSALKGATQTIRTFKPLVLVEINESTYQIAGYTAGDVLAFFRTLDYHPFAFNREAVLVRSAEHLRGRVSGNEDGRHRTLRRHPDSANRLDPGHAGHVQVHHDHLGRELTHQSDRVRSRPGLTGDLYPALLEQVPQPRAEQVVVVYQQDADVGGNFLALDLDGVAQCPPFRGGAEKSSQ
jgi:hypothetical protein